MASCSGSREIEDNNKPWGFTCFSKLLYISAWYSHVQGRLIFFFLEANTSCRSIGSVHRRANASERLDY